jgi:hypothetical protein
MIKAKGKETLVAPSDITRRNLLKTIWPGIVAFAAAPLMAGCERFRHEKYDCSSNKLGIVEIIVNDDRAGASVTVTKVTGDTVMTIGNITDDEMMMVSDQLVLIINRHSGVMQATAGKVTSYITCEKTLFTM